MDVEDRIRLEEFRQLKKEICVSLMKMSPLTAVLKCPHYEKGDFNNESEREAEVPSSADGYRWQNHLKGSQQIDKGLLPACETAEKETDQ